MRRKYHSPELRREAIRQVVEYRHSARDVAEQLHIGQDTVRVWVRRHREERTTSPAYLAGVSERASTAAERELLQRMIEMHLLRKAG